MATIKSSLNTKELKKVAASISSGKKAERDGSGNLTMLQATADEITNATNIEDLINDTATFQLAKFYLKQIEDLRTEVSELHAYLVDAFGTDSTSAASQGAKGDTGATGATGAQGPQGATGATGPQGPAGADGKNGSNAAVSGVTGGTSVLINTKGSTITLNFENGLLESIS